MIIQPEQKVKNKKIVLAAILVFICAFCVFAYFNQGRFLNMKFLFTGQTNTNSKSILKVQYDATQKPTFTTYDNKVLSITKDGIKAINMENKVAWEIKYTFNNPIVKTEEKHVLVGDIGGTDLYLYQGDKKLWSKTIKGTITNIKLNKNGYVLVFCENDKGKQLIGYSSKGTEILKRDYGKEGFLVNADISKDNKKVVALSLYTEKSRVASKIDLFEIKSSIDVNSVPISGVLREDTLANNIKIFDNGNIVLTADNKIIALDSTGNEKWLKEFTNLKVFKADISSGNYVILETNGTITNKIFQNKSRQIQVINADGVVEGDGVKITSSSVDVDTYDNYFIISDATNLYSIAKGKLIWNCPIGKDIKYAKGFLGKSQILIVTKEYFEVIGII